MIEGKVVVLVKKTDENKKHKLQERFYSRGGNPEVVGVVTYQLGSRKTKITPSYKLLFPDGTIDYISLQNFDKFYDFEALRY
ncbi:hypothetical protein [Paenibacillus lactis]|uniref:hypothetical protein n=1 Tax=Paenibacillus lactis TaxID=228574 RepID=UPI003D7587AE